MDADKREQLNMFLSRLAGGEEDALDGIYLIASGVMFGLARSIVGSISDAEDVVSDSFVKIAVNARGFLRGSNGYAWIMKITRNTALDFLRTRNRRAEINIDECFSLTDRCYDEDKRDEAIMLESAMRKLGDTEKKLIYYSYYLDMNVREIAKQLGMSKSAVSRNLQKAEKQLKDLLVQADSNAARRSTK